MSLYNQQQMKENHIQTRRYLYKICIQISDYADINIFSHFFRSNVDRSLNYINFPVCVFGLLFLAPRKNDLICNNRL